MKEYVVWRISERQIDWFHLHEGRYAQLPVDADDSVRSRVFPGLWLCVPALLAGDLARVLATLQQGLVSAAHAEFVATLRERTGP